jgi:putative transposase
VLHDNSRCPHTQPNRTPAEIEKIVQCIRLELYNRAQFCGAQAMRWRLADLAVHPLPSVRTIGRILVRHELMARLRRVFLGDPFVPAANTS